MKQPNAKIRIGHIKNAFIYAFNYFLLDFTYVEAIKSILLAGGDTDTNACIAGGLIGASEGFKNLPKEIVDKMLNWTYGLLFIIKLLILNLIRKRRRL